MTRIVVAVTFIAVLGMLGLWRYRAVQAERLADELAFCELLILDALKSPSSYRRIRALRGQESKNGPRIIQAFITFEAKNPMGVSLRELGYCEFDDGTDALYRRLRRADIEGAPIADETGMLARTILAESALRKRRAHQATPWGALGF